MKQEICCHVHELLSTKMHRLFAAESISELTDLNFAAISRGSATGLNLDHGVDFRGYGFPVKGVDHIDPALDVVRQKAQITLGKFLRQVRNRCGIEAYIGKFRRKLCGDLSTQQIVDEQFGFCLVFGALQNYQIINGTDSPAWPA